MHADEHLILHGLAIKKHATAAEVANTVGTPVEDAERVLAKAATAGRVAALGDTYALLPVTRIILRGEYSRHYAEVRASRTFQEAYTRFEKVNEDLKSLITAWQVREVPGGGSVSNDHSDQEYDARIIDRLGALHERFEPTLAQLSSVLPRLARYAEHLDAALEKAENGDHSWVSTVKLPSYHTVWFELHEDLLCILGRTRVE